MTLRHNWVMKNGDMVVNVVTGVGAHPEAQTMQ